MSINLHKNDLPDALFETLNKSERLAIDTETMGLNPNRDPLCLVQISSGDDTAHIVQLDRETYNAPNLKKLLSNPKITQIFHFARFDIAIIKKYLGIECGPVFCTRTASKLVRTYTDRHGLRDVCRELLGVELNKQQQSSYWGAEDINENQLSYAANDVLYLHALMDEFAKRLDREGRTDLAQRCFDFLSTRADLDLAGWPENDIFAH